MPTPARRPLALVTGATGAVGPTLVRHLQGAGYRVRILARSAPPIGLFDTPPEVVSGALSDEKALAGAVRGVCCVFHLAAKLHLSNPPPAVRAEYHAVNAEGTRSLVAAADAAGVGRFVCFSTISIYGPSQEGLIWDEESPLRPDSWYAESKARAEEYALASPETVVLRVAAVYGPGMKGNYARLQAAIRRGRFLPVGDGRNRRTLIHVDDLAAAALLAAEHPGAAGRIYNATDGSIHQLRKIIHAICLANGRRPPAIALPTGPVLVAAGLVERLYGLAGRQPPIDRNAVRKFTEDIAVSGARMQRELGFRPRHDLLSDWPGLEQGGE